MHHLARLQEVRTKSATDTSRSYFSNDLYKFLRDLKAHNNREWFARNKERYERAYLEPSLRFIKDAGHELKTISPFLVADPKPFGGSLFRIYRDIRFSKDKSPYKTNLAMEFWHRKGDGHSSPGLYLHIGLDENFLGAGVWHPEASDLKKIRKTIATQPDTWRRALASKVQLSGESLKRPPAGFPADHEFIDDLKRKDFITGGSFTRRDIFSASFMTDFIRLAKKTNPLNKFLAAALNLPW